MPFQSLVPLPCWRHHVVLCTPAQRGNRTLQQQQRDSLSGQQQDQGNQSPWHACYVQRFESSHLTQTEKNEKCHKASDYTLYEYSRLSNGSTLLSLGHPKWSDFSSLQPLETNSKAQLWSSGGSKGTPGTESVHHWAQPGLLVACEEDLQDLHCNLSNVACNQHILLTSRSTELVSTVIQFRPWHNSYYEMQLESNNI